MRFCSCLSSLGDRARVLPVLRGLSFGRPLRFWAVLLDFGGVLLDFWVVLLDFWAVLLDFRAVLLDFGWQNESEFDQFLLENNAFSKKIPCGAINHPHAPTRGDKNRRGGTAPASSHSRSVLRDFWVQK